MQQKRLHKTRKVIKTAAACFLLVFLIGPFFWSFFSGSSCSGWSSRDYRKVPLEVEEVLAAAANTDVKSIPTLPAGLEGMAVTFTGDTFLVGDPSAKLLIHEVTHHLQADHDGQLAFMGRYAVEFLGGLYSGCGTFDSYKNISYEKQARRLAHATQFRFRLHGKTTSDFISDHDAFATAMARSATSK